MTAAPERQSLVDSLALRLAPLARESTRDWWNRYLKGTIPFRGVPMAEVRRAVHALWDEEGLDDWSHDEKLAVCLAFFAQPYAEDKLAAILVLSERLVAELAIEDVPTLAKPFELGHVFEWSTCDWYCVKVLGRFVERAQDPRAAAEAIAAWRDAESLWQRRAAAVSFVNLAPRGEAAVPGLPALVVEVCAANARDPQRFSQTSVGWVLRELSNAEPELVARFVEANVDVLSREARRMATAKLPLALRRHLNPEGRKR